MGYHYDYEDPMDASPPLAVNITTRQGVVDTSDSRGLQSLFQEPWCWYVSFDGILDFVF